MKPVSVFIKKQFNASIVSATLTLLISSLLVISDSLIAGFFLGENAVAAISSVNPLFTAVYFVAIMLSEGCEMLYPYEIGRMDKEKASGYFNTSFWACVSAGLLILLVNFFFKDIYLDSINLSGQIREYADEYLSFNTYTFALFPIFILFSLVILMDGGSTVCIIGNLFQVVVNIISSIIFTRLWGMKGVAIGSIVGTVGAIIIQSTHFFKKSSTLEIHLHFNFKELFSVAKYSMVDAACYLFIGALSYVINMYISNTAGQAYLSVYGVVLSVIELELPFDGIGDALFGLVGTYRGEGDFPAVKDTMHYSINLAVIEGIVVGIIILCIAPYTPSFYSIETPALAADTIKAVKIISASMLFKSLCFLLLSYYITIDKIGISLTLTFITYFVSPFITVLTGGSLGGVDGLWYGLAADPALELVLAFIFLRIILKKDRFPYILDVNNPNIWNFGFTLSDEEVISLRDKVKALLEEKQIDAQKANIIQLMIEECFMLVKEQNPGKKITCEFSLFLTDEIKIIFRDDGKIFDMTDCDSQITSFRSYIVSNMMEHHHDKAYQITTEYNRNIFKFAPENAPRSVQ